MRALVLAFGLTAALSSPSARAVDGDILQGFGTDAEYPGYGFYPGPYAGSNLDAVIGLNADAGGRLWLFADVQAGQSSYRALVYRLGADGYPDFDFAPFGYITLVPPCAGARLVDATLDGQDRPWLLFGGCGDYELYRLTPAGQPDTSLLGSGRLSIAFDLGGDNVDYPLRLAITPAGGVVVAGRVDSATGRRVGLAHFTADGDPAPGFGNAGRVDVDFNWSVARIGGVHPMADGRIVVTGDTQQNPADITQFVVRVLASGAGDLAFGNIAPGVSELNLRAATGSQTFGAVTRHSLVEPNGAVVQVGLWQSDAQPNDGSEILLLRWRPDGQPDTGIGPFGHRLYGLNPGGDPNDPNRNSDGGYAVVRQGDGKLVLAGTSIDIQGHTQLALLRLRRDLQPDTRFGNAGWVTDRVQVGPQGLFTMRPRSVLLRPGSLVTSLQVLTPSGYLPTLRGAHNDLLYADTFD